MIVDSSKWAAKGDKFERNAQIVRQPAKELSSVSAQYLFMKWSMDIVGPMPLVPRGMRFLFVLAGNFSKKIKAKAFLNVKDIHVEGFVLKNIICLHGSSWEIVPCRGIL